MHTHSYDTDAASWRCARTTETTGAPGNLHIDLCIISRRARASQSRLTCKYAAYAAHRCLCWWRLVCANIRRMCVLVCMLALRTHTHTRQPQRTNSPTHQRRRRRRSIEFIRSHVCAAAPHTETDDDIEHAAHTHTHTLQRGDDDVFVCVHVCTMGLCTLTCVVGACARVRVCVCIAVMSTSAAHRTGGAALPVPAYHNVCVHLIYDGR